MAISLDWMAFSYLHLVHTTVSGHPVLHEKDQHLFRM